MINITLFTYGELTKITEKALEEFNGLKDVNINIIEAVFDKALKYGKSLENDSQPHVLISGGANYSILKNNLSLPVVNIKVTGFDILSAIKKASFISNEIVLFTYQKPIRVLKEVNDLLHVSIKQKVYSSDQDVNKEVKRLAEQKCNAVIIGASFTADAAKKYNMDYILVYTKDAILEAINTALNIGQTQLKERRKTEEMRTIIDYVHDGVIAIDNKGKIKVFNPIASKLVNKKKEEALNKRADEIIPNSRMIEVLRTGREELNQIQKLGHNKILTNRVPIKVYNETVGVVATFQHIKKIQEAEEKIRKELYKKGFVAKYQLDDIIGKSSIINQTKELAKIYAKTNSTILITGESGTGKELFAHSIHNISLRKDKPFVAINCAAIPDNLLESELFGYEKGAFCECQVKFYDFC